VDGLLLAVVVVALVVLVQMALVATQEKAAQA
jgi:hypothetical protein